MQPDAQPTPSDEPTPQPQPAYQPQPVQAPQARPPGVMASDPLPPLVPSMSHDQLTPSGKRLMNMIEFDPQEQLICEIHKHPFGLVLIYAGGFGLVLVVLLLAIIGSAFLPDSVEGVGSDLSSWRPAIILLGLVISGITVLGTLASAYIYRNNIILITNQKITQLLQQTMVSRKVSQLSIGDIQDVTVRQNDLFSRMFKYGTLVIETAGEQNNYIFNFVPNPHECAKAIVATHERDVHLHGN